MRRRLRVPLTAVVTSALASVPLAAGGIVATPGVAHADTAPALACANVVGTVLTSTDASGQVAWTLSAQGVCEPVTIGTPQLVTVAGTATSPGRGYCTGGLVTTNLDLEVDLSFQDLLSGAVTTQHQSWIVPVTPGTFALPFVIGSGATGAGTVLTRIFGQCPGTATGTPVANLNWVQG